METKAQFEQVVVDAVGNAKRFADDSIRQVETFAKESPEKAIAYSIGIGYFISFLPIFGLVNLLVRIVLRLVRPVLIILSIAKVCELVCAGCKKAESKPEQGAPL
jgi:hypothetical protein